MARKWIDRHVVEDRGHSTPCWIFQGCVLNSGYGIKRTPTRRGGTASPTTAHRAYFEQYVHEIPAGMQIDHLCRVKLCVNPKHLEVVTPLENMRRRREAKSREV